MKTLPSLSATRGGPRTRRPTTGRVGPRWGRPFRLLLGVQVEVAVAEQGAGGAAVTAASAEGEVEGKGCQVGDAGGEEGGGVGEGLAGEEESEGG